MPRVDWLILSSLWRQPMSVKNKEPYQQAYYPPVPTGFTRSMRSFLPWQFIRFWVINFKIFKLLMKSNHG
jgi:hypothetical protein